MSKWGPRDLQEWREGSLLRPVGLSKRTALITLGAWVAAIAAFALLRPDDIALSIPALLFGGLAIRYIMARLGGRPAIFTPEGDTLIEEDSAFQWRLFVDAFMILLLILSVCMAVLGREVLKWIPWV